MNQDITPTHFIELFKTQVKSESGSIEDLRHKFDAFYLQYQKPFNVTISKIKVNDISVTWIIPDNVSLKDKVILFIHGGAFMMGSTQGHLDIISRVAIQTGIKVLSVDYRLIPEHPFPKGFEDVLNAYNHLINESYKPKDIFIFGFSAGATLGLALLNSLSNHAKPQPGACVAISPATDLHFETDTMISNQTTDWINQDGLQSVTTMYLSDQINEIRNPLASPIFGELRALCPIKILVGDNEILYDDARNFKSKVEKQNGEITLSVYKDMFHCWPAFASVYTPAKKALEEVAHTILEYCSN